MIFDQKKHRVLALVLAAGFSNRYGPKDKRKAQLGGTTLLGVTIENIRQHLPNVAVVIRPEDSPRELGIPRGTPVIRAANAANGMGASIADAISMLMANRELLKHNTNKRTEAIGLFLGDMPLIAEETFRTLTERVRENRIVRPVCDGKQGHPVLFGRDFWPQLTTLTGDEGGKRILQQAQEFVDLVDVADRGILQDIDTPEQLSQQQNTAVSDSNNSGSENVEATC